MTISRRILDEKLNSLKNLMEPPALDIGGERELGIGSFKKPDIKWYYLNIDGRYSPDVLATCYSLPFSEGSFNTVVMCELLEHLKDTDRVLDEAYRVLNTDGRLFLSMPFIYRHHRNPADFQRWTHEKIYDELENRRGFKIEVFLPRGGWLATLLDIYTQGATAFVPGTFFGSRILRILGGLFTWIVNRTYPIWSRFDRYLSREDVTKSIFHRFTTGYLVVAKKIGKETKDKETGCDILRFPKER
jgi:SAM-dependent methyltransferase